MLPAMTFTSGGPRDSAAVLLAALADELRLSARLPKNASEGAGGNSVEPGRISAERGMEERQGQAGAVASGGDFTGWEQDVLKFDSQLQNVIRALRADNGGTEKPPERRL